MNLKYPILVFCILLTLSCQKAAAQLFCTNATEQPVWVAVAFHQTNKVAGVWTEGRWVTEGWLFLWPNETAQLSTHIGADASFGLAYEFYYFAYQPFAGGKQWGGDRNFLVELDPKATVNHYKMDFHINESDKLKAFSEYPFLFPLSFRYATGLRSGSYTIVLTPYN